MWMTCGKLNSDCIAGSMTCPESIYLPGHGTPCPCKRDIYTSSAFTHYFFYPSLYLLSSMRRRDFGGRDIEERYRDNGIDRQQHHPFQPVRFAVLRDKRRYQPCRYQHDKLITG